MEEIRETMKFDRCEKMKEEVDVTEIKIGK